MTDDIVTQLRIQADVVNGNDYHTISGGLHLDAADEIERLRAELQELQMYENAHKELLQAYRWSHAHLGEWPDAIAGLVAENYELKKVVRGE